MPPGPTVLLFGEGLVCPGQRVSCHSNTASCSWSLYTESFPSTSPCCDIARGPLAGCQQMLSEPSSHCSHDHLNLFTSSPSEVSSCSNTKLKHLFYSPTWKYLSFQLPGKLFLKVNLKHNSYLSKVAHAYSPSSLGG